MSEQKSRHTVWLSPEAWEQVERRYRKDNCSTKKMNMLVGTFFLENIKSVIYTRTRKEIGRQ